MLLLELGLLSLGLGMVLGAGHPPFIVKFQWNYINYTWPSQEVYYHAVKDENYVEKNNVLSGIKHWKDNMYLTIPRWRSGVPVTLATTPSEPVDKDTAPKLQPYPSWDMQKIGDCSAFQFVQNIEIDPKGRMWVLDTGRVATLTLESKADCPPRLVILDLENNGVVLREFPFPPEVANPETCILNDIVVDHTEGGMAYITDSDERNPGIIVFSLENGTSWKVTDDSMKAKPDAVGIIVDRIQVKNAFPIDGIALSPADTEADRTLYYSPLSSFQLFSVQTKYLKDEVERADIHLKVKVLGRKPSQSDGMTMTNAGVLYFGLLGDDAVSMWDTKQLTNFAQGQRIISRDHHLMQWPDSFAFDQKGQLWCITNRLHKFLDNSLNIEEPNFRAIVSITNTANYQYYSNKSSPELPDIPAGASSIVSRNQIFLATGLSLLMLLIAQ